jgi:hypothetical protein
MGKPHRVFLSRQAVEVLRQVQQLTGRIPNPRRHFRLPSISQRPNASLLASVASVTPGTRRCNASAIGTDEAPSPEAGGAALFAAL